MGFMCCGKTRVGKLLANRLDWPFIDTDDCIVGETGLTIPEIFEQKGEPVFRQLEKKWIKKISQFQMHVVALGGGAVVDSENWEIISKSGLTITLSYPPEIFELRLSRKADRPLMNNADEESRLSRIHSLLKKREAFYKQADLIVHLNKEVEAEQVAEMLYGFIRGGE